MKNNLFIRKIRAIYSSQYKKMLILYSVFTIIVLLISAYILIGNYNKSLIAESEKANKRLLTQLMLSSDMLLQESVMSLIYSTFVNLNGNKLFHDFFHDNELYNVLTLTRIMDYFNETTAGKNYIDSVYLYRTADDTIVSSKEGYVRSIFSENNYNRDMIDTSAIEKLQSSKEQSLWIGPYENSRYWLNKCIISIAYSIPVNRKSYNLGCIVINLNEQNFFKSINYVQDSKLGEILIIDSRGRIFSRSKKEMLLQTEFAEPYITSILKDNDGFTAIDVNGIRTVISWVKSSVCDWWYVSVIPIETLNRQTMLLKQFSLLLLALVALLSVISVNILTVRIYKPFRQLIKNISKKFSIENNDNAYDNEINIVNNIITKLSDKVEEMEETLECNNRLIRHKAVLDIINGTGSYTLQENREKLKVIGVQLEYDKFCLLVTEADMKDMLKLSPEQSEFIGYKIIEITDAFFPADNTSISVSIARNRVVTLTNTDKPDIIVDELPALVKYLESELGIRCNIAFSHVTECLEKLAEEYEFTCGLLKYSFIYNYGKVFNPSVIDKLEKSINYLDIRDFDSLIPLIKAYKITQLKAKIESIFNEIYGECFSYNYVQNLLMQLTSVLSNTIKEQNIKFDLLDRKFIFDEFSRVSSLKEYKEWLNSIMDVYAEGIRLRDEQTDNEFITRIKEFICANIQTDLNLNNVASHFGISSNYLSKIFKESTDICFSNFIVDKKLELARELLINKKDLQIKEIAMRLGYFNTPHFINIFKEKYGITPAKFRKSNYRG